jgi:O-antigen/teichoic acid export membrane protein
MKVLQKLGVSEFWVNVSKLATGTIASQVLAILFTPFITRIFDAKDIGTLNLFNQIVGLMVVVSMLRLDRAIILADDNEAKKLVNAGFSIILCFFMLLLLISFPFQSFWIRFFGLSYPAYFILTIPAAFFLQSIINLFKTGGNTFKLYSTMAKGLFIQALLVQFLKLFFGLNLGAGPAWLILAELLAATMVIIYYVFELGKKAQFKIEIIGWIDLKRLLLEHKSFIKFDVPASLLNFLSWSAASFLLAYFFDAKTVGYYALGFTMLRLPMNLLGKAIGDVFYKKSAGEASDIVMLRKSSNQVVIQLFSFGLLPIMAVFFFGDVLFSFFFGKQWIPAGEYSQVLSFWTFIWFISSPISNLYYILGLQHKFLQFMAVSLIIRALAIVIAAKFFDAKSAIVFYSIASLLVYGYQLIYLLKMLKTDFKQLVANIFKGSSFALGAIILMFILNMLSLATPILMLIIFPTIGLSMAWRWFKRPKLLIQ